MMLVEENQVPLSALPVDALKRQLRLGSGFAEDDVQDGILASFLQAALAAIEARTGKALISRGFVLSLGAWRDPLAHPLPIAPVSTITQVTIIDALGHAETIDPAGYRLKADAFAPCLVGVSGGLPTVPSGGALEIRLQAGFGASFEDLPADLAHAVLLLAAHYYEYRDETALGQGCMPFGVTSLIARYRNIRIGAGA